MIKKFKIVSLFMLWINLGLTAQKAKEQHRPRYHFTPSYGWMNDPNGLVFYKGTYHMFYQYYPDATVWGPMHWGHAVSKDLVSWEHKPIALYPDSLGYIFSGSIVIDKSNSSGLGTADNPPLVALFTYHDMKKEKQGRQDIESQGLAYSLDNGETWIKYKANPVIPNIGKRDFRDPKVIFFNPSKEWIMTLAVGDHVEFYGSKNLLNWEKRGSFGENDGAHGGVWECPDLMEIKADDGTIKWVLIENIGKGAINGGSGIQYFVGHFNGETFINDNPPKSTLWLDYGPDNYAGVTWYGAGTTQKKYYIGWMSNWDDYATKVPTDAWRSGMTLTRELSLKKTNGQYELYQKPISNISTYKNNASIVFEKGIAKVSPTAYYKIELNTIKDQKLRFKNELGEYIEIGVKSKKVYMDRTKSGKVNFSNKFKSIYFSPEIQTSKLILDVYTDVSSIEIFINGGKYAMSALYFPNINFNKLQFENKKVMLKAYSIIK